MKHLPETVKWAAAIVITVAGLGLWLTILFAIAVCIPQPGATLVGAAYGILSFILVDSWVRGEK